MPAVSLTPADLTPFATIPDDKAQAMIDDALETAYLIAPCIKEDDFAYQGAAKAVIRGAILRWNDTGAGGVTTQSTAGPISETVTTLRRSMYWPSEIEQLQSMCRDGKKAGAFTVDTAPTGQVGHSIWCNLNLGGDTCSCGANLTHAEPLWEFP
ncbi:head-tail adaptor [Gordonia phage Lucky10]|uniref:Head-to-tail adaptor n=1 Tax=Gordonia phage Lucky10 TaxID=1821557 RepID=A0A142KAW8_9CAUD|nr:head-tail adaptor [Gordonia phage Lucky10]AMS03251.1 head-to-tail adaptor [Gordonia phage Lucky10]